MSAPCRDLLTVKQLADWLAVHPSTVYGWVADGYGPAPVRLGRAVRFRRVDVDAWLAAKVAREPVAVVIPHGALARLRAGAGVSQ